LLTITPVYMWLRRSVRKRKAETVQSDTVGYYHRSKLCCLGIHT